MSRSRKKIPIFGNAGTSDKSSKRKANRKERSEINQTMNSFEVDACIDSSFVKEVWDDVELPIKREISDVWDFAKDGKHYFKNCEAKDYRK